MKRKLTHEQKKRLSLDAHMEGQQQVVANIGDRVTVSEMELICLTNFAEIGLMSLFAMLEGKAGQDAERCLERSMEAIRGMFATDKTDGLQRLSQSTVAMLRSEKFQKYIVA